MAESVLPLFPEESLAAGRPAGPREIRQRAQSLQEAAGESDLALARGLVAEAVRAFWEGLDLPFSLRPLASGVDLASPSPGLAREARSFGREVAALGAEEGIYEIGLLHTGLLPKAFRSGYGVFYTPPGLADRLLTQAGEAGVDWGQDRILDPACGGGAFLIPVARRLLAALPDTGPGARLDAVAQRLEGFEVDPFAAWLSQVGLDAVLAPAAAAAERSLPAVVTVRDSLWDGAPEGAFDLVVGNPPYGRAKLSQEQRRHYARSLYGHANLYGLFTDAALRMARPGGVIAYVTPTSFLAGGYYRNLRSLLGREAPPRFLEFVEARAGVFADVLQETLLATYRLGDHDNGCAVATLTPGTGGQVQVTPVGTVHLPPDPSGPWPIPRNPGQAELVAAMEAQPARLADWGYTVRTGPLVWNRKKDQLADTPGPDTYPLIWAEAVTAGGAFVFRATKRNHRPYFRAQEGDGWLLQRQPAVLLQRTTAKEQRRRLLAAAMPGDLIEEYGAVVVENHLNVLQPTAAPPVVPRATLAAFLNSAVADHVFRCFSGSVAVSAYELEALPLPAPGAMAEVTRLVEAGADREAIDAACARIYYGRD